MIFNWFGPKKYSTVEQNPIWEYSEQPIVVNNFNAEHEEIMSLIASIEQKIDELKILIDEKKKQK